MAARWGSAGVIKLLLDHGADIQGANHKVCAHTFLDNTSSCMTAANVLASPSACAPNVSLAGVYQ